MAFIIAVSAAAVNLFIGRPLPR